jgi:hypothetical protein
MRKGLLLVLAGLMAFFGMTAQSMASSRMESMGADYRQFDDQDQIWLYPNKALLYKDTIDFRLNSTTDGSTQLFGSTGYDAMEWGGVLKDAGDIGVIGAYFNRPSMLANNWFQSEQDYWGQYSTRDWINSTMYGQPFTPTGGTLNWTNNIYNNLSANINPENKVDIFWADSFSGIDLGAVVNYGDSQTYGSNVNEYAQDLGINIGAGFGAVGPFNSLNAHLGYQMGAYNSNNNVKDNGISTLPFGLLGDINLDANNTLRVFLDGQMDQFALQTVNLATNYTEKDAQSHFLLGAAINKKISGGKGLASLGLFADYGDWEYTSTQVAGSPKYDYAYWDLIANFSVETPVSSWLTWRAGLTRQFFSRNWYNNGGNAESYGDNWTSGNTSHSGYAMFNTGFSINVENWTLDAYLSSAALENWLGDPSAGFVINDYGQNGNNNPPLEIIGLDAKVKI